MAFVQGSTTTRIMLTTCSIYRPIFHRHLVSVVYVRPLRLWGTDSYEVYASLSIPTKAAGGSEATTVDVRIQREQYREDKVATFIEQSFPLALSPCPSLCKSVGSSAASTASTSAPPTPLPSPLLGEPKIHGKGLEGAALVNTKGLVCGVSDLVIQDIQQATSKPALPCPDSLVRKASNFVPIRLFAVCTTSKTDPFGAFAESYFADEPKASAVSADAVPDLYDLDIYALRSAPPKCQRPREVKVISTAPQSMGFMERRALKQV